MTELNEKTTQKTVENNRLIERKKLHASPFEIEVRQDDVRLLLGNIPIEIATDEEELLNKIDSWDFMSRYIITLVNFVLEEKKQEEKKLTNNQKSL